MFEFVRGVQEVAGHSHPPCPQDSVEADDELGAVGHDDAYPITLVHTELLECRGKAVDGIIELAVAHLAVHDTRAHAGTKDDGRFLGVLSCRVDQ